MTTDADDIVAVSAGFSRGWWALHSLLLSVPCLLSAFPRPHRFPDLLLPPPRPRPLLVGFVYLPFHRLLVLIIVLQISHPVAAAGERRAPGRRESRSSSSGNDRRSVCRRTFSIWTIGGITAEFTAKDICVQQFSELYFLAH